MQAKFMIANLHAIGQRLYKMHFGQANLAPREVIAELLGAAAMATRVPQTVTAVTSPFDHPDAQRHSLLGQGYFRSVRNGMTC